MLHEYGYKKPGGVFRVLTSDEGVIVGCGGLYPLANGEAEIRSSKLRRCERSIALYRSAGFKPYDREHLARRCDQAMALDLTR